LGRGGNADRGIDLRTARRQRRKARLAASRRRWVEDQRLGGAVRDGRYLEATDRVLKKHGGLWFNDETFVISRRRY
jgi:hypothetical protein